MRSYGRRPRSPVCIELSVPLLLDPHLGVPPAALRFYTVAYCTPCPPRPLAGRGIDARRPPALAGRVARHLDPPDRDPVYGVQYGALISNMACIPHCMPC